MVAVLYEWSRSEDKRAIYSRRQSNSQFVCKVCTGPPPSPPDLKGLPPSPAPLSEHTAPSEAGACEVVCGVPDMEMVVGT
ncbi:hypothetical protein M1N56_03645 [Dehalococcoidia bacterium]|nr:hypothetical protein [Dehalococcoidia bacterium]